jgi:hypothetical protein
VKLFLLFIGTFLGAIDLKQGETTLGEGRFSRVSRVESSFQKVRPFPNQKTAYRHRKRPPPGPPSNSAIELSFALIFNASETLRLSLIHILQRVVHHISFHVRNRFHSNSPLLASVD